MVYGLYVMRDLKVGFLSPNVDSNDASAIRNFAHAIMSSQNVMHTHPQDFELYKLGTYETDTAEIKLLDVRELIFEGKDVENA